MKVSVVIPAYNAAATLADTITSMIVQTVPDWEVIVVDDGSTDDTRAIAAALAERDDRIRIISQANGGESSARNAGIAEARHGWLLFLDADDWIAPTHLQCLSVALDLDPALDAIHCGWVRVSQDGTEIPETYRPPTGDLFPVLARRAAFPVHACLIRRSLVVAAGGFDVSLKKSPDWDLWQRIARGGANFGSVPDVLAYYRMAPNSASLEAEQMFLDGMTILRRGHAPDPRVGNPLPQYADGLPGSTVESQEFYLLSWCAGLLLGSGEDAERLLKHVRGERYAGLYANAIAQCVFEAATLPSCRPRQAWEDLWPQISSQTTGFLMALEAQSQTKDLAARALTELKKLILKSSPVWGAVIDQQETNAASLEDEITKIAADSAWLQSNRDEWRQRAEELERTTELISGKLSERDLRTKELEASTVSLQSALQVSIRHAEEMKREVQAANQELAAADRRLAGLEQKENLMDVELSETRARVQILEAESERLRQELEEWRQSASARAFLIEDLQHDTWMRLGLWLRVMKRRELEPATMLMPTIPGATGERSAASDAATPENWDLRVADGSEANVIYPREDHHMIRIGISKAGTQTEWDIQLNRGGLRAVGGVRYAVCFRARSARPRTIGLGFAKAHAPWSSLGMYTKIRLTPEWQIFHEEFVAIEDDDEARIHFDLGGRKIGVDLTSVALRVVETARVAKETGDNIANSGRVS